MAYTVTYRNNKTGREVVYKMPGLNGSLSRKQTATWPHSILGAEERVFKYLQEIINSK